jgi:hypothetical protein
MHALHDHAHRDYVAAKRVDDIPTAVHRAEPSDTPRAAGTLHVLPIVTIHDDYEVGLLEVGTTYERRPMRCKIEITGRRQLDDLRRRRPTRRDMKAAGTYVHVSIYPLTQQCRSVGAPADVAVTYDENAAYRASSDCPVATHLRAKRRPAASQAPNDRPCFSLRKFVHSRHSQV